MSQANEIQHGGSHYKKQKIQHWDFVTDNNVRYLEGCGSKYLTRYRDKNGREDLDKAGHYVQKILEKHLQDGYSNTYSGTLTAASDFCKAAGMDALSTAAFVNLILWDNEKDLLTVLDLIQRLKVAVYG